MSEKKQFSGWDFVILIFSIFSLALLPIQMLYRGQEDVLQIVDCADYVLCSFFFADFVKQFIQAKGARLAYMKYGWIDLLSSIPIQGAQFGRVFRILRILKVIRQVSKLIAFCLSVKVTVDRIEAWFTKDPANKLTGPGCSGL